MRAHGRDINPLRPSQIITRTSTRPLPQNAQQLTSTRSWRRKVQNLRPSVPRLALRLVYGRRPPTTSRRRPWPAADVPARRSRPADAVGAPPHAGAARHAGAAAGESESERRSPCFDCDDSRLCSHAVKQVFVQESQLRKSTRPRPASPRSLHIDPRSPSTRRRCVCLTAWRPAYAVAAASCRWARVLVLVAASAR